MHALSVAVAVSTAVAPTMVVGGIVCFVMTVAHWWKEES